jgi:predicted CoA-binding protein
MHADILEDDRRIAELLSRVRRVAVLGIKTEAQGEKPAYYVAQALQQDGLEIVPVPVYYPEVREILGQRVYRSLAEVPGEVDLVDVFRRAEHIDAHVDDILAKKPKAVWFQLGIRNDGAAARLVAAGIDVVQDRCLMVEYERLVRWR